MEMFWLSWLRRVYQDESTHAQICPIFHLMPGQTATDQFGEILPIHDLLAWFGLSECFTPTEQLCMTKELSAMIEAEQFIEKLKQLEQLRSACRSRACFFQTSAKRASATVIVVHIRMGEPPHRVVYLELLK